MPVSPDIAAWFERLVDKFNHDNTKVSDWELGIFKDQIQRWDEYGTDIRWSAKQFMILDRIASKFKMPAHDADQGALPLDDRGPPQDLSDEIPF